MLQKLLNVSFIYVALIIMCEASNPTDFFQTNNLALISWEHAVNSKNKMENSLKTDVQMLEADVQLGNTTESPETNIPIMAHPPSKVSDLSLTEFLKNISEFNSKSGRHQKGIKLDFKSIEAFNASIAILRAQNINQASFPVWLNADIIKGPGNPVVMPVDERNFLSQSKLFPNVTLSVGWTTNYDNSTLNASYSRENVAQMVQTLKVNGINQSITFPVRAVYAVESFEEMNALIGNVSGASLTIWSAENDLVDVGKLRGLIEKIGMDKVYVDVPKKLMDQLGLSGSAQPTFGLLSVALSAFLLMFIVF